MNVVERMQKAWARVVADWKRGVRLAHEAKVAGDTALFAIDTDTPEGDIQASAQRAGFALQIKLLEQRRQEHPLSFSDELQLRQLRRVVRRIDQAEAQRHPTPENMGPQRLAAFGQVGQPRGFLGSLPMPPWAAVLTNPVVIGVILFSVPAAFGAMQTARLNHAKDELTQTRDALHTAETSIATLQANVEAHEQALHDARANALATRQTIDTLERQRRAAAAAERRRQHDIQSTLSGIGDPPDFGLRDDALRPAGGNNPGAGNGGAG